ncbi:monovalent cation/H+ antiporter complex subunit F [Devosia sp. CAU 1758]
MLDLVTPRGVAMLSMILVILAALIDIYQIVASKRLADRIWAIDTFGIVAICFICTYSVLTGQFLYLDIAIGVALVSFLATVAYARYLHLRGRTAAAEGADDV